MRTRIAECACVSKFQDERYGHQKRVFNNAPKRGEEPERWRCTVCLALRNLGKPRA